MLEKLISRKLIGALVGVAGIVVLLLGLAALKPEIVTTEVLAGALTAIAGLVGSQVLSQASLDRADTNTDKRAADALIRMVDAASAVPPDTNDPYRT